MTTTITKRPEKPKREKLPTPRKEVARRAVGQPPVDTVSVAGTDDDPAQKYMPGVEPERDAEIERVMGTLIDLDIAAADLRRDRKATRGGLTELMRDRKLTAYRFRGKIAKYKPGTDSVQIAEAPEK